MLLVCFLLLVHVYDDSVMLLSQLVLLPKLWDFTAKFCHSMHSKNHLHSEGREEFYILISLKF